MSSAPKEGTARYYEVLWNEWREERKRVGRWFSEREQRSLLTHPVPFEELVAELNLLARLLESDLPRQIIREIESRRLINGERRWIQVRGEDPEIRMILGREAEKMISRGRKADPTYGYIAWDCSIEASDFAAAKQQVRRAHTDYLASLKKN